jgi:hypothetical protein
MLIITAGILAFFNGMLAFVGESSSIWFDVDVGVNRYSVCGSMLMLFGIIGIVGGVAAITYKSMSLALAGAALGAMGDGLAGFVFGLTAIVLLFISDEEF